jgi:L-threonylcarbamoyladenylate synthase
MRRLSAAALGEGEYIEIANLLRGGGLAAIPTDTVYGVAVDASREEAVDRVFRLKGRPRNQPVILLVESVEMAAELTCPPPIFAALAARFWPGPVTFVLPAPGMSDALTGGTGTIALRWPASGVAVRIIRALGGPITSTSANRSGEKVAISADGVASALAGIDLLVDGGPLGEGPASTLVDLTSDPPRLLRQGPVSYAEIDRFLGGRLDLDPGRGSA